MTARTASKRPDPVRGGLILLTLAFLGLVVLLPLLLVFLEAFEAGGRAWAAAVSDHAALSALWLSVATAAIVVPINAAIGMAAAWCLARFRFPGRTLVLTLFDLPLAVSPVVAGLLVLTLFGSQGPVGHFLMARGIRLVFSFPGIVVATLFVTFPFVARELIPILQATGTEEEESARVLGANGWSLFWRVTFPHIRWGLVYGMVLANARALGEFGAVSVVSGHIRGKTNTLPLHVETLYNEYHFQAAFAVASVLTTVALLTLALKTWADLRGRARHRATLAQDQGA